MQASLFENNEIDLLDAHQASDMIGVSIATLKNWIRAGLLEYTDNGRYFNAKHIIKLKKDILEGKIERLNNRANKKNSKSTFIPIEQLSEKGKLPKLQLFVELVSKLNLPVEVVLFTHSLTVLRKAELIDYKVPIKEINDISFQGESIKRLLNEWANKLELKDFSKLKPIIEQDETFSFDSLGVLYQSILEEGKKSQGGSYYTPRELIHHMTGDLTGNIQNNVKILDPCCGTGQFLVAFSSIVTNPLMLWGYDIDPIAVQIAKINLIISYPQIDFYPNIFVANSLVDKTNELFDIVITNPPWGYHFTKEEGKTLQRMYPVVKTNEAFSYFLVRGINALNENGFLYYVLPESITKVKKHKDIREFILKHTSIISLKHLGNVFSKVLSSVITLKIKKQKPIRNIIRITQKDKTFEEIKQVRFERNKEYYFDSNITNYDAQIISKIYNRKFITLEDNADWALGIVTGNNTKFLSNKQELDNELVLKGANIKKYKYDTGFSYISFKPEQFQQVAPSWKYRASEKLIYKFISNNLVFSYDNNQVLTLNSANILIPKISDIPIKVVLLFLNSGLFQYIWKKKFNTVKILRGDLEQLPFPIIDKDIISKFEAYADILIRVENNKTEEVVDEMIYNLFELTTTEKDYIKKFNKK